MDETTIEALAQELLGVAGGILLPLGVQMIVGLALGVVVAALFRVVYTRLTRRRRAGAVGLLAAILFAICGFFIPLAMGIERAANELTDVVIDRIEPQINQMLLAEGLDPEQIDPAEIQIVIDEFLTELDAADEAEIPASQEEQMRQIAEEVRQAVDDGAVLSTRGLAVRMRDRLLAPLSTWMPIVTGMLIGIPVVFVVVALLVGRRSTAQ